MDSLEGQEKKKAKILIVDDKEINIIAIEKLLSEFNVDFVRAYSGPMALTLSWKYDFALAIVDVNMPDMDGFETAALLREEKKEKICPIIFVTALEKDSVQLLKAFQVGGMDYIEKPIVPEILKGKIKILLDLYFQKMILEDEVENRKKVEEKLKDNEKALIRAKEAADYANRTKSRFLANMSHEIRTPLNAILGMAEVLKNENLSTSEQKRYLDIIIGSGSSLLEIINNILDLSKVESGEISIEEKEFDLEILVNNVVEMFSTHKKIKDVHLRLEKDPDLPLTVLGDALRIKQILVNLIGNALKFTEKGEVLLKVSSREDLSNNYGHDVICFSVQDTGIGMSKDSIQKVFSEFVQADQSITRQFGGTGLGLSISNKLTEMMKGRLSASSEMGKGSIFICEIPMLVVQKKKISDAKFIPNLEGMKVLISGLKDEDLSFIEKEIKSTGAELMIKPSLKEGELELEKMDLIIVSQTSKGKDLEEMNFINKIHEGLYSDKLIMLASNEGHGEDMARMKSSNVSHYLLRPLSRKNLFSLVENILSGKKKLFKKTLLIVDDEKDIRELFVTQFESSNINLKFASNGLEALTLIKTNEVDAVVCDFNMPKMNADQLLEKTSISHPDLSFIIISGKVDENFLDKTKFPQILRFFPKPFDLSELVPFAINAVNNGFQKRVHRQVQINQNILKDEKLPKLKLLIVEDVQENKLLLSLFLKNYPFELSYAENGEQAYILVKDSLLQGRPYDIVLMDMQMPVMDGFTSTQMIRNFEKELKSQNSNTEKHIPIIAQTAHAYEDEIQKCFQSGCDFHITKPFKKDQLLRKILEAHSSKSEKKFL